MADIRSTFFPSFRLLETLLRTLGKVDSSILVDIDGADPLVHAIVIQPANKSLTPKRTILLPHGGPHGSSTYDFSPSVAAFALAGYNVVLPNYSGSLGLGQEFAHSLLGKAGTLDVADCLAVVKLLVDMSSGYHSLNLPRWKRMDSDHILLPSIISPP